MYENERNFCMKIIDKFLKKLNVNRNTFATYILLLVSLYIMVDRLVEILLIIFTGVSYSYWGPIQYTLALACPVFAFLFSGKSEFATSNAQKVSIFNFFVIIFATIAISMFVQWLNMAVWLFLVSVPGYVDLVTNFSELFRPALTSIAIFIPFLIGYKVFNFLYFDVNDTKDEIRSIWDYGGIDLSNTKEGHGPYTCEIFLCTDKETGKTITIPESSRYQCTFVCGGSGTGKTASPADAQAMHKAIREYIAKIRSTSAAENIRILYGGSMKPENAKELMACPDIDGGLVGGASLKADQFLKIINFDK